MPHRDANQANQPALVPLFGGLDKKVRPLDRDVVVVGQARGCDIALKAPEVSTLHCIIYRSGDGLRLRDCGSRTGTRLNGAAVRNQLLADQDVLQVGPFSFQVNLPECRGESPQRGAGLERLERARQNLIRLALKLRKRCRLLAVGGAEGDLKQREADLKARIRSYDNRAGQLEQAERELERDRDKMRAEKEAALARVRKIEDELAERLEETERNIHGRWQEFQKRCGDEEKRVEQRARQLQDEAGKLEGQKRQLAERDQKQADSHKSAADELERQRQEFTTMKDAWEAQQGGDYRERQAVENHLSEQRREISRMMADLRELQQTLLRQQRADVPALQQENEELRRRVVELEQAAVSQPQENAPDHDDAEALESLRAAVQQLHEESERWKAVAAEKDRQVAELARKADRPATAPNKTASDLESYEAELNRERQQLETERARMNAEMEQLRQRNAELDEATREMEMELSRERAELARERIRLDRLREEVRLESERMQRDAGVRESLAGVNKLREEIQQKKAPASDNRINERLQSLRGR